MNRAIDYYFSLLSPWAYIGHAHFQAVAEANACAVNYKPLPLLNLFDETGGMPLARRHPLRQRYRMIELQRWRDKRGLNFVLKPKHWPFDASQADRVAIAALHSGQDPEPYLRRAFRAIWEQERDLTDPAELVALAHESGLEGDTLLARASSGEVLRDYEQNREEAIEAGVFGSPAYVLDGEVFWGQDRIELLADALASQRAAFTA